MVKRIIDLINGLIKWTLVLLFFVMVVVVFLQVLFRFVLDQPLAWTEELSRYLLVWITFLGAGYAVSVKAHPSIEILFERSGGFIRKIMIVVSAALVLFFFYHIIINSFEFIERSTRQKSPALQLPMGLVYTVIPISGILFSVNMLYITISEWGKEENR